MQSEDIAASITEKLLAILVMHRSSSGVQMWGSYALYQTVSYNSTYSLAIPPLCALNMIIFPIVILPFLPSCLSLAMSLCRVPFACSKEQWLYGQVSRKPGPSRRRSTNLCAALDWFGYSLSVYMWLHIMYILCQNLEVFLSLCTSCTIYRCFGGLHWLY